MNQPIRVSIFTASFGEGHNTAAKNIRDALNRHDNVVVEICDLYQRTNPRLNSSLQIGYSVAINRFPTVWKGVFGLLGVRGLLETMLPTLAALREAMHGHLREFQPDIILSTYPVYSFLVRKIRQQSPFLTAPLITIVTDSTRINSAWFRCPSDAWVVSDELTASALEEDGADPARIQALGFPVSPAFAELRPLTEEQSAPPNKLLFLPSSRKRHTIQCLQELLSIPDVQLTVMTGKFPGLRAAIEKAGFHRSPHVKLLGWTDQMPALMASHHAFIGKAGGAVVQEAIAAKIPFLVSHVVPGQEEGNIELIEKLDFGRKAAASPQLLGSTVRECFADNAKLWKTWKRNLEGLSRPHAVEKIADFVLSFSGKKTETTS